MRRDKQRERRTCGHTDLVQQQHNLFVAGAHDQALDLQRAAAHWVARVQHLDDHVAGFNHLLARQCRRSALQHRTQARLVELAEEGALVGAGVAGVGARSSLRGLKAVAAPLGVPDQLVQRLGRCTAARSKLRHTQTSTLLLTLLVFFIFDLPTLCIAQFPYENEIPNNDNKKTTLYEPI
jgi:hypothetical protein